MRMAFLKLCIYHGFITQVAWLQLRQWGKPLGTVEANPFYLKGNGAEEIMGPIDRKECRNDLYMCLALDFSFCS